MFDHCQLGQLEWHPVCKKLDQLYPEGSLSEQVKLKEENKSHFDNRTHTRLTALFTEARDSEWQWHQLGRMQVCNSLQTDNNATTPSLKFSTGQMPFLPPKQQSQSTKKCFFLQYRKKSTLSYHRK